MGQVLTGGSGQNPARQASMKSGIPKEKPAFIVNQVCGSGLRSIASGFHSILSNNSNIVVQLGLPKESQRLMMKENQILIGTFNAYQNKDKIKNFSSKKHPLPPLFTKKNIPLL